MSINNPSYVTVKCPEVECINHEPEMDATYCYVCGSQLIKYIVVCPKCEVDVDYEVSRYCPDCGTKLERVEI